MQRTHANLDTVPTPQTDAAPAIRTAAPGLLAVALLLALSASVATAGAIEWTDPTRSDRREAPRELTVRWLTDAVAKAARDLAAAETLANTRVSAHAIVTGAAIRPCVPARAGVTARSVDPPCPDDRAAWSAQGLINLPPPSTR